MGITQQHGQACPACGGRDRRGGQGFQKRVELLCDQQRASHGDRPLGFRHAVRFGVLQVVDGILRVAQHQRGLAEQQPGHAILAVLLQHLFGLDVGRAVLAVGFIFCRRRQTAVLAAQSASAQRRCQQSQQQPASNASLVRMIRHARCSLKSLEDTAINGYRRVCLYRACPSGHRVSAV